MRWRIRPLESAARRGTRSTLGSAALASIALAGMIGLQIKANGRHLDDWDLMTVSGTGTFLARLLLAQGLPAHFWAMVDRLINRGALIGTDHAEVADVSALIKRQMDAAGNRWERSCAFAVAATMAMAVIVGAITVNYPDIVVVIGSVLFVTASGYFAGRSIGRALAYRHPSSSA